ncbi:GFA family protein [Rhizobium leguminosarum]|uniref:GFA family protein n=1 Tax=Rhizobium leguminosarum TaxID=384 RepID=UPI003F9D816F
MNNKTTHLTCACGTFHLEVRGAPIISAECHCKSCSDAAGRLESLPMPEAIRTIHGGTRYVLYRKDRISLLAGTENLQEFRLGPNASTRRVLASCCNTPIFLEFKGGHWLSLYGNLWKQDELPPLQLRTMTQNVPDRASVPDDVPSGALATVGFYGRLLTAWIAMGFKVPDITVKGAIDA